MTEWHSGFVEANGIRLHYTRTGAGALRAKPPVVLAHGLPTPGRAGCRRQRHWRRTTT